MDSGVRADVIKEIQGVEPHVTDVVSGPGGSQSSTPVGHDISSHV